MAVKGNVADESFGTEYLIFGRKGGLAYREIEKSASCPGLAVFRAVS